MQDEKDSPREERDDREGKRTNEVPPETAEYLSAVKAASPLPVCAGFGVRRADQVALLGKHADGVVVGSALVEVLERGADPAVFLRSLRT